MNTKFYAIKIFKQIALAITLSIILIEGIALVLSISNRRQQLNEIVRVLEEDLISKEGKTFHDLHPTILNQKDINIRMEKYTKNIIIIIFIISIVVLGSTLLIFHLMVGRHIGRVILMNRTYKNAQNSDVLRYPEELIPNNEMGELLTSRNSMLDELSEYEKNLEHKIKSMSEKLVHSAKLSALGEFSSSIAHDMVNPLTVVGLSVRKIKKLNENEKNIQHFERIELALDRISKLMIKMRDFGALNREHSEGVLISKVISNATSLVSNKISRDTVGIHIKIPADQSCYADEVGLEQVFANLISNSLDALTLSTPPRSQEETRAIHISSELLDKEVQIKVRDNGSGIPKNVQKNIFDSFFTTKKQGEGTGLGLSNCLAILNSFGGDIILNQEHIKGTEFILTIPIKAPC